MGKKKWNINETHVGYLLILLTTLFVCIPLFFRTLDMFRDDGIQHIARAMGIYQSIEEKQFFPMIMSQFCNGFGYSWNLFYSPITAYIPVIFKLLPITFTACIKITMFICVLISGIAMYHFLKKVTKQNWISVLAAIIYIVLPYRLTDMYSRNALAELVSFIFIPVVFHGIYNILQGEKKTYLLSIGIIRINIISHCYYNVYGNFCRNIFIDRMEKVKE